MNRLKGFCPCCTQPVELYTDGLGGGAYLYRCGNCFHGFSEEQIEQTKDLQRKLAKLDEERLALMQDALKGGL